MFVNFYTFTLVLHQPLYFLKAIKYFSCLYLSNGYTYHNLPRRCTSYRQESRRNSSRSRYIDYPPATIRLLNEPGKVSDGLCTRDKVPRHGNKLKKNDFARG